MMSSNGSSGARARKRLPRLAIVRRLASGVSVERVALGTGLAPHEVEALLTERGFQRAVEAYRDLLASPPEVRLQRLYTLALQTLEQALVEGCRLTLVFMLREAGKGRDPAARLAENIDRRLKEAPPPEPPAAPAPAQPPPGAGDDPPGAAGEPAASAAAQTARRPDPFDAMAWRTAARLRREMLDEAALAAQPSPAAPSPATPPPAAPAAARPAAAGP